MQTCMLHHTGVEQAASGVIKNGLVYLLGEDGQLYFPEKMLMAIEECEKGLIQFEVEGKWGFADIYTGEIEIQPVWDYAGPFYRGYAHVSTEAELEYITSNYMIIHGGKHGYIDPKGQIVIPLDYDGAYDIPCGHNFIVYKNEKQGLIDNQNRVLIPFEWDTLETAYKRLIFANITVPSKLHAGLEDRLLTKISKMQPEPTCTERVKWGVFDQNGNMIVQAELDEKPENFFIQESKRYLFASKYYLLKGKGKYGVLSEGGKLIADITLLEREATDLITALSQ